MLKLILEDGVLEITGTTEDLEELSQNLYRRSTNITQTFEVSMPNELPDTIFTIDKLQVFEE